MADAVYGSGSLRRTAAAKAAEAALKLGGEYTWGSRRDAAWRARPDGVLEVARAHWGRIELFEVLSDGTSQLVARSKRSWSKVAANVCFCLCVASFVAAIVGGMAGVDAAVALFAVALLSFPLTFLLQGRSALRPWLRGHFGSDFDWVGVPYKIEGNPTTGNQAVALAAVAGSGDVRYRVVDDGRLEVVKHGKDVEVLSIDEHGTTTLTETLPGRRFRLSELRGDVTWHQVQSSSPD